MWTALPGPQTDALTSKADILFYGGAAGGGKTDLLLGAALQHDRSIIFRREYPQLKAIVDRGQQIIGNRGTLNRSDLFWHFPNGQQIELGAVSLAGSEEKFQGRAHDLKAFDEIGHFLESQFRFLCGWMRHPDPHQRKRVIAAGNPPTDSEGDWVLSFWGPWLDSTHPFPAKPGELRWFTTIDGKDTEREDGKPFFWKGELITPMSRTFIPARVQDNPFYMKSGYMATLQGMPEPLRSKMLYGSFSAGREDNEWQVIPSAWVLLAQERWKTTPKPNTKLSALGVDVARGGKDKTCIAPRYDAWFDHVVTYPGKETPDGDALALLVMKEHTNPDAKVNIDIIGVGAAAYDALRRYIKTKAIPMNASEKSEIRDKTGNIGFVNQRSEWIWTLREALDPDTGDNLCIPPDRELMADLCAPRYKLTVRGIQIELKDDIKKRIGRSPDKGDAFINAFAIKHLPGQGFIDYYASEAERMNIPLPGSASADKRVSEPAPHVPSSGFIKS